MTDCKVCYHVYSESRTHCPVCGTLAMTDVVIDSITTLEAYMENRKMILSRTIEGKVIQPARGCERVSQHLYPVIPHQVD